MKLHMSLMPYGFAFNVLLFSRRNTLLKIFKGTPDDFQQVIMLTPVQ